MKRLLGQPAPEAHLTMGMTTVPPPGPTTSVMAVATATSSQLLPQTSTRSTQKGTSVSPGGLGGIETVAVPSTPDLYVAGGQSFSPKVVGRQARHVGQIDAALVGVRIVVGDVARCVRRRHRAIA